MTATQHRYDLPGYLARAHQLLGTSEKNYIALMKLLVELHGYPKLWRSEYPLWDDLLTKEKLCTPTRFERFYDGLKKHKLPVDDLGVEATCLLASYPNHLRVKATKQTTEWVHGHRGTKPTYQCVSQFVRGLKPTLVKRAGVRELRAYIKELQALCDAHKITYPEEPK